MSIQNYYALADAKMGTLSRTFDGASAPGWDNDLARMKSDYTSPGNIARDRRDVFRYEGYFEGGVWHPNENLPAEPATAPKPTELAPELAAVVSSRYVAIEDHPSGAYMGKVLGSNSRNASLDRAITSHDYKTDKAFTLYEAVAHVSAKPAPVPQPERVVVRAG